MTASTGAQSAARPAPIDDLSRFAVHTITTKPWPIEQAIDAYARAGFGGISVWRDALDGRDVQKVRAQLRSAGLRGVSLVRGGFFAHNDPAARSRALEDNRRAIDEAASLELPLIVLVCGADPQLGLVESRRMIADAIAELTPEATAAGVRLGIEPLHPMYADTRSAVNTLAQANQIAAQVNRATGTADQVCSVVDVYHLWWDPDLAGQIQRAGDDSILGALHVCDWRVPTEHMLLDRGLMGEGCIDIPQIRSWVERAGFDGPIEVEIFSERYWKLDQDEWLAAVARACRSAV